MWGARIATFLAAICGNATHVYLGALTIVGGWPAFVSQFKRGYELTACFSCTVQNNIFMYVVWFGGPFYLLSIAAFATRSVPVIAATLISVAGLIVLDVSWYYSGNSKDWYIVLSPLVLGGIALIGLIVLLLAGRSRREQSTEKGAVNS